MPVFHHSVAVLRLLFRLHVSRCRFRTLFPLRISMPWLVGVDDWLASNGTTATEK